MKNLFLIGLVVLAYYLYTHRQPEAPVEEAAPVVQTKPALPKLHYHSPLDAPAVPVAVNTGTGYYSEDNSSRFDMHAAKRTGARSLNQGATPVYNGGGTGGTATNGMRYRGVGSTSSVGTDGVTTQ